MAEPSVGPPASGALSERLRSLRTQVRETRVTQAMLAAALKVSVPSISSWESGAAVPPPERLRDYALVFATGRTFLQPEPTIPDEEELTPSEEKRRQALTDELGMLRDRALRPEGAPGPETGALGGRFWHFSDGAPIRIITTPMWPAGEQVPYADPWHPNHIAALHDADRDATTELYGHIRAENPTADVRFLTADQATEDDLLGHVVVLGQDELLDRRADGQVRRNAGLIGYLAARLELPFGSRVPEGGDPEFDAEFVITLNEDGAPTYYPHGATPPGQEIYRPRFLREPTAPRSPRIRRDGVPLLEYDVAFLVRRPNQLNLACTVTGCAGIFSRGTYGAVRSLTDPLIRSRNEAYLLDHFGGSDDFWLFFYVPVFQGLTGMRTITPDLTRPFHRLRASR